MKRRAPKAWRREFRRAFEAQSAELRALREYTARCERRIAHLRAIRELNEFLIRQQAKMIRQADSIIREHVSV